MTETLNAEEWGDTPMSKSSDSEDDDIMSPMSPKSNFSNNNEDNQIKSVPVEDKQTSPLKKQPTTLISEDKSFKYNYDNYYGIEKDTDNIDRKKFINYRYNRIKYYLENPSAIDSLVRKRWLGTFKRRLNGCLYGIFDGAYTCTAVTGKYGTHGGWLFGALHQLTAIIVSPFVGGIHGLILGFYTSQEEVAALMRDYRYTYGSTAGKELIKHNITMFPGYKIPDYISDGDRLYYQDKIVSINAENPKIKTDS